MNQFQIYGHKVCSWKRANSQQQERIVSGVFVDCVTEFTVDTRSVSKTSGDDTVRIFLTAPSSLVAECGPVNNHDGTYLVAYTPFEEGKLNSLGGAADLSIF